LQNLDLFQAIYGQKILDTSQLFISDMIRMQLSGVCLCQWFPTSGPFHILICWNSPSGGMKHLSWP